MRSIVASFALHPAKLITTDGRPHHIDSTPEEGFRSRLDFSRSFESYPAAWNDQTDTMCARRYSGVISNQHNILKTELGGITSATTREIRLAAGILFPLD